MYSDDDLLPISALQHILFCPRQCALIHLERLWVENRYTAEGRVLHERVDKRGGRPGKGVRVVYAMDLKNRRLGLTGKADTVEFHADGSRWMPYPVEYKRGASKKGNHDRVQLCAQALCLEEMHDLFIDEGALFYGKTRRRESVLFSDSLREETVKTAYALHALFDSGITPEAVYTKRCDTCSFLGVCMPKVLGRGRVQRYLKEIIRG